MHAIAAVAVQSLFRLTLDGNGTWLFVFLTLDGRKEYAFNIALMAVFTCGRPGNLNTSLLQLAAGLARSIQFGGWLDRLRLRHSWLLGRGVVRWLGWLRLGRWLPVSV